MGSSGAGSGMPWKHQPSEGCWGCPLLQQELGQLHPCAQGLSLPVHWTHLRSEHFPVIISIGDLFQNKCWDFTSSEQTRCATSSHCCTVLLVPIQLDVTQEKSCSEQRWWPVVAPLEQLCCPGARQHLWGALLLHGWSRMQRTMGTARGCGFSRCCHSDSAPRRRERRLLCPQQSLSYCVWLMPASEITSPDFLVNDLRQNRDN